jgi:type I restriction enzyme R subunit
MPGYTERSLVAQPAIVLFEQLGWSHLDCFDEQFGPGGTLGRENAGEVVLVRRLREALEKLNREVPPEGIEQAVAELIHDRSLMSMVQANRETYKLLKDGILVRFRDARGNQQEERVRVVDWEHPKENDFFLASEFWISGEMYRRRADLVGFVNGIPLLFIELKSCHKRLEDAYEKNLRDYKDTIPHVLWYNGFIILSNGSASRIGSITAEFEHFSEWKRINSEGEKGIVSLETMIRGTCEPARVLDILENFVLFSEEKQLVKLVAKNHQYLGVNNALAAVLKLKHNRGRLGVFWHTQGAGKSYSMVFFSQKVMRKLPGNWTFVIVTDRDDLDQQIYKNFARCGAVYENEVQATSGKHLKQLLSEDHRHVFTLIQKFGTKKGAKYPKLSERSDIIVITDEAHRSQYDLLALNMRTALPNAAFIGFTGTPLIVTEEKTREVFGDYVSIYNFQQSIEDRATVPLYYENRKPDLQLTNKDLNEDMERLLEEAELDEAQEKKLEQEFAREYHLITRKDRLNKVARDIVSHFMGRGQMGKAMVVCIDKATAVRMYNRVRKEWDKLLSELKRQYRNGDKVQQEELEPKIRYMETTDMAVVVSQGQNEIGDLRKKGLDIKPHRKRMEKEDLDEKFKNPDDPFRIVFVCAMWMTGFDVPCCNTIYLDKPMRNHTLMQTIARANRVFRDKEDGLIVDYAGVFRNLKRALAIYGSASGGGVRPGDTPVVRKELLFKRLEEKIAATKVFLKGLGTDLDVIHGREGFEVVQLIDEAYDSVVGRDQSKQEFLGLANEVDRLFLAVLPDPRANPFALDRRLIHMIACRIRSEQEAADIGGVMVQVNALLDASIVAEPARKAVKRVNLRELDLKSLLKRFEQGKKRTEADRLRQTVAGALNRMVLLNRTRLDFLDRLQKMIDEYNAGTLNVEEFYAQLLELTAGLQEEEKRGIRENLTEEELAVFDLLTRPDMHLTQKEVLQVKRIARELLQSLKTEKLVLDWRKKQQSRASVRLCIEEMLAELPERHPEGVRQNKGETVYQHIYDSYFGSDQSIYSLSA